MSEENLGVVVERIKSLHEDVHDLKDTLQESVREMSKAIQSLVRVEERQVMLTQNTDILREEVKAMERRLDALEREAPMQKQIQKWVLTAVGFAVMLVAGFIAKFTGLM